MPRILSGRLHLHAERRQRAGGRARWPPVWSRDQQRQSAQQQQLSFKHARSAPRKDQNQQTARAAGKGATRAETYKSQAPGRPPRWLGRNPPLGVPGPRPRRPTSDTPRSCTQLQFAHARRRRRPSSKVQGSKATRAAASRTQSGRGLSARVSGKAELLEPLRVKSSLAAGIPPLWYPRRPDQTLFSFFSSRKRSESDQSPVTHPARVQTRLSASPHRTTKDGSVRE